MGELGRELHNELHNLALNLGFKRSQYTIDIVHEHEFLYKGIETRVTIASKDKQQFIYLKIKQRPTTTGDFEIPWANCFFNNVHYYSTVLPILKTYGNVPMSPKYYGSSLKNGEEFIILEDVERSENYNILGPYPGLSKGHVKEVVRTLAYFHCTVQLWKNRNPQQFSRICSEFKPFLSTRYALKTKDHRYVNLLKEIFTGIFQLMNRQGGSGGNVYPNFQKLMPNIRKFIDHALKDGKDVEDQTWTTIANCYTYTSNILFKCHTVTGAVIDVGLEDWGAARLGSPALDLCLLLLSAPATELYAEISSLVNDYFSESLTIAQLKEGHIEVYGIFGLFGAVYITIAKAIEDRMDMKLEAFTSKTLSDGLFKSNTIPDVEERLIAIVKAAIEIKVF